MEIEKGINKTAVKLVITGSEGIGKTTLASQCPSPLFIDTESGSKLMNVHRVKGVKDWQSLLSTVAEIYKMEQKCEYSSVVIDTLDWAEIWCINQVKANNQVKSIENIPYGRGWTMIQEEFMRLLNGLTAIVNENHKNVILIAHSIMRKYEEPDQMGSYDRWELKLSKKVAPMVKEWADALLFLNYKTKTVVDANNNKKAVAGERVIYTSHHPCWDAKNRFGLKDCLKLDYENIKSIFE